MNYLELCREALRAAGTDSPRSMDGVGPGRASDYESQVALCVRQAWLDIQHLHPDWGWSAARLVARVERGVSRVSPRGLGVERFGQWRGDGLWLAAPLSDPAAKGRLRRISYPEWRRMTGSGPPRPGARLREWGQAPNLDLLLHPVPSEPQLLDGEYRKGAQSLAADGDEPDGLPAEHRMAIVWRAVALMHGSDSDGDGYAFARNAYLQALEPLRRQMLPGTGVGGTLA